jgi:hypothetical protein
VTDPGGSGGTAEELAGPGGGTGEGELEHPARTGASTIAITATPVFRSRIMIFPQC